MKTRAALGLSAAFAASLIIHEAGLLWGFNRYEAKIAGGLPPVASPEMSDFAGMAGEIAEAMQAEEMDSTVQQDETSSEPPEAFEDETPPPEETPSDIVEEAAITPPDTLSAAPPEALTNLPPEEPAASQALANLPPEALVSPDEMQPEIARPLAPTVALAETIEVSPSLPMVSITPPAATSPENTEVPKPETLSALDTPDTLTLSRRPMMRPDDLKVPERPKPVQAKAQPKAKTKPKPKTKKAKPKPTRDAKRAQKTQQRKVKGTRNKTQKTTQRGTSKRAGRAKAAGNAAASNYGGLVLRRIARVRKPRVGVRGSATVAFKVSSSGGLAGASIARSSGSAALDRAALQVVRRAAPFPAPPAGARRSFTVKIVGR